MERQNIYLMTLGASLSAAVVSLAALNEARLDAYVSISTVVYFAASAVLSPRRKTPDLLGLSLLLIFSGIVALRVLEILFK